MRFQSGSLLVSFVSRPHPCPTVISTNGSIVTTTGRIVYSFRGNDIPSSWTPLQIAHDILLGVAKHNEWVRDLAKIDTNSTNEFRFIMNEVA